MNILWAAIELLTATDVGLRVLTVTVARFKQKLGVSANFSSTPIKFHEWISVSDSCVVGLATTLPARRSEVRIPVGGTDLSLVRKRPDQLWSPPSLLFNGYRRSLPRYSRRSVKLITVSYLCSRSMTSWCWQGKFHLIRSVVFELSHADRHNESTYWCQRAKKSILMKNPTECSLHRSLLYMSLNVIQGVFYHVYYNLCSALSRQNILFSYNLRLVRFGQLMYFPTQNTVSPTNGTQ